MAAPRSRWKASPTDDEQLIAVLSDQFQVSAQQVGETFRQEMDRLAADARICDFLAVLALRSTRAILRGGAPRSK